MSASSVPSRIPSPSSFTSSPISPASEWFPSATPCTYTSTRTIYSNLFPPSPEERLNPRPLYRRHNQYYFSDGNIIFLVDGMLYNIHRYFFQRDSSNFASMFSTIPHGGSGKGLTDDNPIALPRVATKDFDLFLSILYPSEFGVYAATTVAEWTAILSFAVNWNFKSIKALAIKNLACIASPIDRIFLGRKYDIEEWLGDAYEAVCLREEPLTLEDGLRLGMEDVIKISAARQHIHRQPACRPSALSNSIRETFGLEVLHKQELIAPVGQGKNVNTGELNVPLVICPPSPIQLPELIDTGSNIRSPKMTSKAKQKKARNEKRSAVTAELESQE